LFTYPHINPIAFSLGPLKVHWYGLMYLFGFVAAWLLMRYRAKKFNYNWSSEQIADIVFYGALGVILGGRIGYVLFYNFPQYMHHPLTIFAVWDGGMSFHGGMIGVFLAMWAWSIRYKVPYFQLTDFIAPVVPIGLAAGRVGNFINGELWGRVTDVPWAMIYPQVDNLPRHPSEVYEFLLEGVLLFIILWFYSARRPPRIAVSGVFLICYGSFRFFCECFRQPDAQLGFVAFNWLTMGQLLCLPMIILGIILLIIAYVKRVNTHST
jgi:phosphatidylglycerol:prolipoprotein diacylglycerol transferase